MVMVGRNSCENEWTFHPLIVSYMSVQAYIQYISLAFFSHLYGQYLNYFDSNSMKPADCINGHFRSSILFNHIHTK